MTRYGSLKYVPHLWFFLQLPVQQYLPTEHFTLHHVIFCSHIQFKDGRKKQVSFRSLIDTILLVVQPLIGMKSICFAGMQKRSCECYISLFLALKQAANRFGFPLSFKIHLMDFEIAAAKASNHVFPKAAVSFCHFHFARAIWKHIRTKRESF